MERKNCPVCNEPSNVSPSANGSKEYNTYECLRCGVYEIEVTDEINLSHRVLKSIGAVSHFIRKNYENNRLPGFHHFEITHEVYEKTLFNLDKISPAEQADNLILYLGKKLLEPFRSHSDMLDLGHHEEIKLCSITGCENKEGLYYIIEHLRNGLVILFNESTGNGNARPIEKRKLGLTFEGWQKYNELLKTSKDSRQVFMAMKYNDKDLDDLYKNFLKDAVKETGLELVRLDEVGKAGLIDNNMRAEIRKSCLLLADLTHDNNGAYWEAGYAEGLGIPVIYLCEKDKFDKKKTHFDTNHCTTIIWEKGKEDEAIRSLKSTIRISMPGKSK